MQGITANIINPLATRLTMRAKAMWKLTKYLKAELLEYKDCHVITTRKEQEKDLALYSRGGVKRLKDMTYLYPTTLNAVAKALG